VTREHVRLALAGRTDRGVHAVGQVASGRVAWDGELERLRFATDSLTGDDISVYRVAEVDDTFHARFSAVRREYRYRVFVSHLKPVLLRGLVWPVQMALDVERMNDASSIVRGEHDFRSFAGAGTGSGDGPDQLHDPAGSRRPIARRRGRRSAIRLNTTCIYPTSPSPCAKSSRWADTAKWVSAGL
jgi:tRNA pseudouridine38-40 synthase